MQRARQFHPLNRDCLLLNLLVFLFIFSFTEDVHSSNNEKPLRVIYFSKDVPAIDPLFPAFDPDSYAVITQIFDSLVHFNLDGEATPALALNWRRLNETQWLFNLRQGVKFHNGEVFDGHSVKFTYETAIDPKQKAGNAWILSSIKSIEVDQKNPYQVIITTHFPDGMFINRLNLFGSICPPGYIKKVGLDGFYQHPIGTGPYQFVRWVKGQFIELNKNPHYWNPQLPKIAAVRFDIVPETKWVDRFINGQVDFLPNLAGNQTTRLKKLAKGEAKILKRRVLSGYWVLLNNRGLLADKRIRQAMNYAVNKKHLVKFGDLGNAEPLASLGKKGEFGANSSLTPYPFDPKKAKALLLEAGVQLPITLKVIVADIAAPIGKIMKKNYQNIGINLEMSIVPRAEWAEKVVNYKIRTGKPSDYDLAINLVDNPIYNLAFHAGLFLHSQSPWSLLVDKSFDQQFIKALQTVDHEQHKKRLEELDALIHEQALMVFTTQRIITAAVRKGINIEKFGLNGHLDYYILTTAEYD